MLTYNFYIRFRNTDVSYETFKIKLTSPFDLSDTDEFDDFVIENIDCDMEQNGSNIIWLMFKTFDQKWVDDLILEWKNALCFELPAFGLWEKIGSLNEAYE